MKKLNSKIVICIISLIFTFALVGCGLISPTDDEPSLTVTENNGLGYSVNVLFAENYGDLEYGYEVLDMSELTNSDFEINLIERTYTETFSASSIRDFYSSQDVGYQIKVGNKYKAAMFSNVALGLKQSSSLDYSSNYSKYYFVTEQYIEKYSMHIKNYLDYDYSDILAENFISSLDELQNGEITYTEFFDKYGTHIVVSAKYGGKLDAYFSCITEATTIDSSDSTKIAAKVSAGLSKVSSTSASLKLSIAEELGISESRLETSFYTYTYGGSTFTGSGIETFADNQQSWSESFNDSENYVLIDYADDGLVPLWDILPPEYASLEEILENGYVQYYNSNMEKMMNEFELNNDILVPYVYDSSINSMIGTRTIQGDGLFGMNTDFIQSDQLDLSSLIDYNTEDYVYKFEIIMNMKEVDQGYQEVWLYNRFRTDDKTNSTTLIRDYAMGSGMVSGVHNIEYGGSVTKNIYGDEVVTMYIPGNMINETMYLKYDAHGSGGNTWQLQQTNVTVTAILVTEIANDTVNDYVYHDGAYGLHSTNEDIITTLDFSEYSEQFTSYFSYIIVLEVNMKEINSGYQEFWLYNQNDLTFDNAITLNDAIANYGLVTGIDDVEFGGYDVVDTTSSIVFLSFEVTGDQLAESMYVRYDAHGDSSDTWYLNSIIAYVAVIDNTPPE